MQGKTSQDEQYHLLSWRQSEPEPAPTSGRSRNQSQPLTLKKIKIVLVTYRNAKSGGEKQHVEEADVGISYNSQENGED